MFGFDYDEILNGYSKADEFIARDTLILELLVESGVVTQEQIKEKFEHLNDRVKEVHKLREEETHRKCEEIKSKYEKEGKLDD